MTDYNGFVLSVKGEKVVTDVTANDGKWHFIALTWDSFTGQYFVESLIDKNNSQAKRYRSELGNTNSI